MTQIDIHTEIIPLDAFLKWAGLADTGGMAKHQILDGQITVNGDVCRMRGKKLRDGDCVGCNGETYLVCVKGATA